MAHFPNIINLNSAFFFNFQRTSSMFSRLPSRIFQDELIITGLGHAPIDISSEDVVTK